MLENKIRRIKHQIRMEKEEEEELKRKRIQTKGGNIHRVRIVIVKII